MKTRLVMFGFALAVLAGCEDGRQSEGHRPASIGMEQAADQVQTLVADNQPIRFRDGTVLHLPGVVQMETFARVPDSERRFRYQVGIRRTILTQFTDDPLGLSKSISEVMIKGGYSDKVRHPKEGVIILNFVKQGMPTIRVQLESQVDQKNQHRQVMNISWII